MVQSRTIQGAAKASLVGSTFRFATCYLIQKTNNTFVRLTNHSHKILLFGDDFTPAAPVQSSAVRSEGALRATNTDLEGALTSDEITDADLEAGLYRGAQIWEYVVDYLFPHRGAILSEKYTIQAVEWDGDQYRAELTGLAGRLDARIGKVFTRPCMARLGDGECRKVLTDFTFAGLTIDTVQADLRSFTATSDASINSLTENYFRWGEIQFTSGQNNVLKMDVVDYDDGSRLFTFPTEPPFPFLAGDEFTAIAGCDGRRSTCRDKFDHVVDHQGWPFIIGSDRVLKTPTVTS